MSVPVITRVSGEILSASNYFPRFNDTIYLDDAVVHRYAIPAGCDLALINPRVASDGSQGVVYSMLDAGTLFTSAAGSGLSNQPANDSVDVVSSAAGDTTQTVTIYGTTNGTDTVVAESIAMTGTTPATSVKTDWGVILGFSFDAALAGTFTLKETSGGLTITTLAAGGTSKGIQTLTDTDTGGHYIEMVCSGSGTKQIGFIGTDVSGAAQYDSQALNGTTPVFSNSKFSTVTSVLTGDLEATRTVTFYKNSAKAPAADETSGTASFPITAPLFVRVPGGTTMSMVRVGSSTLAVGVACWNSKSTGATS